MITMQATDAPRWLKPLGLIVALTASTLTLACSSDDSPDRDPGGTGGSSGSGGTNANGGAAGLPDEPVLEMPEGCVPSDMRFDCIPMTNEGCDTAAGEACEYGLDQYFTCYEAPNDVAEGGACNWESGPYCEIGLTCDFADPENPSGVCRRHCCANSDCDSPETCVPTDAEFGTLGVCR